MKFIHLFRSGIKEIYSVGNYRKYQREIFLWKDEVNKPLNRPTKGKNNQQNNKWKNYYNGYHRKRKDKRGFYEQIYATKFLG